MAEHDPERAVAVPERRPRVGALQDQDLLAQGQVFQEQVAAGAQEVAQEGEEGCKHDLGIGHGACRLSLKLLLDKRLLSNHGNLLRNL
jgi:hypothetical protein